MKMHHSTCRPPTAEYGTGLDCSIDVLATDGKRWLVCYLQTWDDDELPPAWKMAGRDGYNFDVKVWTELPDLTHSMFMAQ